MRKERSGAGRGHKLIVLLLLLVILLLAAIACGLSLRLYRRSDPALIGRWQMTLDLTDAARTRANAWLEDAEMGTQVDVGDYLPRLSALVRLNLDADGSWSRSLDSASLDTAEKQATSGLAQAVRELLRLRIADAGRPIGTEAELEAHIKAAIGISVEDYLAAYGPTLLPGGDELRARYDGGGSWQIEGPQLRFDGQEPVRYLADEVLLVLDSMERTEVYERARR